MSLTCALIICTRNRLKEINTLLHSIAQQMVLPQQIIIVDSSDITLQNHLSFTQLFSCALFPHSELIYVHTKPGLTYQRNVGISCATADIIYFLDDDVTLENNYFESMQQIFTNYPAYAGGMATIGGMPNYRFTLDRLIRIIFLLQRDYSSGKFTVSGMPTHPYGTAQFKTVQVLNGCGAYRKEVFKEFLFDEQLTGYAAMEDCDFSYRLSRKYKLFFNPHAVLHHYNSTENRDSVVANRAMYIRNYRYLFFKNMYPHNRLKIFAFYWSVLGLFVQALFYRNMKLCKGYVVGLSK